jgi:hypothetical protein
MADLISNLLTLAIFAAIFIALMLVSAQDSQIQGMQERAARWGVEVEAEILGHFEAGIPLGKREGLQPVIASWDPLELELRYIFNGREIISRGRVPIETFFRTRSMKTLKIKVSPDRPEQWAALV